MAAEIEVEIMVGNKLIADLLVVVTSLICQCHEMVRLEIPNTK